MTAVTDKWTLERYHAAIEAGLFDDQNIVLRGALVVMPPEGEPHAACQPRSH